MASMVVFFALGYVATLPILTKYRVEGVATFFTENRLALENEIRVLNSLKETNSDLFNKKFNITQQQNNYLKEIMLLPERLCTRRYSDGKQRLHNVGYGQ